MAKKSRAEYFRKRREQYKSFAVEVEQMRMERLEAYLMRHNLTKKDWFNAKVDEALSEKE